MYLYVLLLLLSTIVQFSTSEDFEKSKPQPTPFQDWDYLVFSQRWPITACEQWQEEKSNNTCAFPSDRKLWTIHGIWPTKIGKNGPYFCDSAIHFDPTLLEPIEADLEIYWLSIEANTKKYSFWKHEWSKHGTCASVLSDVNSVEKYFKLGLEWNKQYNLATILSKNNVTPSNDGYTVEQIYNSVLNILNKKPKIECVVDRYSKQSLINEIRICFNKSLDIIDCDVSSYDLSYRYDDVITNCNMNKPVMYFSKMPTPIIKTTTTTESVWEIDFNEELEYQKNDAHSTYTDKLITLHKVLQFLIWFTL